MAKLGNTMSKKDDPLEDFEPFDNMNTGTDTYTLYSDPLVSDTVDLSSIDGYNLSTISVGSPLVSDTVTISDDLTWSTDYGSADLEIELNGNKRSLKGLAQQVDRIEERLGILRIDPELEQEWDELKKLGDQYRELEQKILDKKKVWNILKDE